MFFNPNDFRRRQERTGPSGLLEIFSREWLTIVKVDALTCLSLVPLVTLPPALLAMNHMARRMAEDRSVTVREFWQSFRRQLLALLSHLLPGGSSACHLPVVQLFLCGPGGRKLDPLFAVCVFCVCVCGVPSYVGLSLSSGRLGDAAGPGGAAELCSGLCPSGPGADVRSAQRLSGRSGDRISSLQHSLFPVGRTDVPLCGRSGDCASSSGPVLS